MRVHGLEGLRAAATQGPVLIVCNHTAYWDSMLAIALVTDVLRLDGYALMEARNLERYPFLGRVGGFGVERDVAGDGARSIAYGAALLDRPGRVVWLFPEGREVPARKRPLRFKRGAASMLVSASSPAVCWMPVAIDYVFGATERPSVWLSCGAAQPRTAAVGPAEVDPVEVDPVEVDPPEVDPAAVDPAAVDPVKLDALAGLQAERVTAELSRIEAAVERFVETGTDDADFPVVLAGRRNPLGALATALLARMTRPSRRRIG